MLSEKYIVPALFPPLAAAFLHVPNVSLHNSFLFLPMTAKDSLFYAPCQKNAFYPVKLFTPIIFLYYDILYIFILSNLQTVRIYESTILILQSPQLQNRISPILTELRRQSPLANSFFSIYPLNNYPFTVYRLPSSYYVSLKYIAYTLYNVSF